MTTATKKKITKTRAKALYKEVRVGLINVEKALTEIIQSEAWEVLGYSSFVEAWDAELKDVPLAASGTLKASVVYAFVETGLSDEEIVEATEGRVGDEAARTLRAKKSRGVKATAVRGHSRGLPSPTGNFTVRFDVDELVHYKEVAGKLGLDLEEEVRLFVKDRIADLERFA